MIKIYNCTLEVRGYELDSFNHVNHAIYIRYMEHARWRMLADEGITPTLFNQWGKWPVIAHIEATYLRPTFLADVLEIRSHVYEHGKTFINFEQSIFKGDLKVFFGKVQAVVVNIKGRPSEIPVPVSKLWSESSEQVALHAKAP